MTDRLSGTLVQFNAEMEFGILMDDSGKKYKFVDMELTSGKPVLQGRYTFFVTEGKAVTVTPDSAPAATTTTATAPQAQPQPQPSPSFQQPVSSALVHVPANHQAVVPVTGSDPNLALQPFINPGMPVNPVLAMMQLDIYGRNSLAAAAAEAERTRQHDKDLAALKEQIKDNAASAQNKALLDEINRLKEAAMNKDITDIRSKQAEEQHNQLIRQQERDRQDQIQRLNEARIQQQARDHAAALAQSHKDTAAALDQQSSFLATQLQSADSRHQAELAAAKAAHDAAIAAANTKADNAVSAATTATATAAAAAARPVFGYYYCAHGRVPRGCNVYGCYNY